MRSYTIGQLGTRLLCRGRHQRASITITSIVRLGCDESIRDCVSRSQCKFCTFSSPQWTHVNPCQMNQAYIWSDLFRFCLVGANCIPDRQLSKASRRPSYWRCLRRWLRTGTRLSLQVINWISFRIIFYSEWQKLCIRCQSHMKLTSVLMK